MTKVPGSAARGGTVQWGMLRENWVGEWCRRPAKEPTLPSFREDLHTSIALPMGATRLR